MRVQRCEEAAKELVRVRDEAGREVEERVRPADEGEE